MFFRPSEVMSVEAHGLDCSVDTPLTEQSHRDSCDIHIILRQAERNNVITHVAKHSPEYGDFVDVPDFQSAMNIVVAAQELFMTVPARVRERFGNDPARFIDFVNDPENSPELVKLGLATPRKDPSDPVQVLHDAIVKAVAPGKTPDDGGDTSPPEAGGKQGRRPR